MKNTLEMSLAMAGFILELNDTKCVSEGKIKAYVSSAEGVDPALVSNMITDEVISYFQKQNITETDLKAKVVKIINNTKKVLPDINKEFLVNYIVFRVLYSNSSDIKLRLEKINACETNEPINNIIYEIDYKNAKLLMMLLSHDKDYEEISRLSNEIKALLVKKADILGG